MTMVLIAYIYIYISVLFLIHTHNFNQLNQRNAPLFSPLITVAVVHSACNLGTFNATIQSRDPLGAGFEDVWGLNLLWKLLQWDPEKRISAAEALEHV
jgi:hypothetical protein